MKQMTTTSSLYIDQLNNQVDFLNEQLALREGQVAQLTETALLYEALQIEHSQLANTNNRLKHENSQLLKQIRHLENVDYELRNKTHNQQLISERNELYHEKQTLTQKIQQLQQSHQSELQSLRNKIEDQHILIKHSEMSNKELQEEILNLQHQDNELLNRIQGLTTDRNILQNRLDEIKNKSMELITDTDDQLLTYRSEIISLQNQVHEHLKVIETQDKEKQSLSQQLQMNLDEINHLNEVVAKLASEIELKENIIKEKSKDAELTVEQREMQLKSQHLEEITRYRQLLEGEVRKKLETEESLSLCRKELKDMESKSEQFLHSISVYAEEKTSLLAQIQEHSKHANKSQEIRSKLEQQVIQLRQIVDALEDRVITSENELKGSNKHQSTLEARINSLIQDNNDIRTKLKLKSKEMQGASEDLGMMTKENQALVGELANISAERDSLKHRLTHLTDSINLLESNLKGVEIERNDLLETYRAVLQDKRKLEQELLAMGTMKQKSNLDVQQLHSELVEAKAVISEFQSTEVRWKSERTSLHSQIESLTEEIRRNEERYDSAVSENRQVLQDVNGLRQTNKVLNDRTQLLLKRISDFSESNNILTTRLSSLEREKDTIHKLLENERHKNSDLSKVIEVIRAQLAGKDVATRKAFQEFGRFKENNTQLSTDSLSHHDLVNSLGLSLDKSIDSSSRKH